MTRIELLIRVWAHRECFICNSRRQCDHREREADLAEAALLLVREAETPRSVAPDQLFFPALLTSQTKVTHVH